MCFVSKKQKQKDGRKKEWNSYKERNRQGIFWQHFRNWLIKFESQCVIFLRQRFGRVGKLYKILWLDYSKIVLSDILNYWIQCYQRIMYLPTLLFTCVNEILFNVSYSLSTNRVIHLLCLKSIQFSTFKRGTIHKSSVLTVFRFKASRVWRSSELW